ncbi:Rieske 2Fe-2S family protein, putative [Talaromyces stipitatus ATCC 10500]|uniref:Choline monooxygenase, chloroplastic n=1 Tax=Talaromyces stipitatus (strain ATCC 10500 / CBS 375.48 / QM 6759 / NRRL 1006) TaxID=441959 RepID=B8M4N8_TALSN|nr:Rieske 2Fe-2S family protein, putative [Talaromyces stipitatus ATCC 10500]EED19233.1 Rieske 2Fe-2S family protein, putative [Talaromyces stipitatus ATCC 10500]
MYELERRAIFSKDWIVVSHQLRLAESGKYVQLQEAGFSFFLVKDRQGNINGFHNVCRHRAYPIVQEKEGSANILACKYHGWSYGLSGKLAKAPRYDDLENFEKEKNGLFPIRVHIDKLGFIWVNLEASEKPTISWEDDFGGVDEQPRLLQFDLSEFQFDHQWDMVGDHNWKILADNYNKCYHCLTGHLNLVNYTDLAKYRVETKGSYIQHFNTDRPDRQGMGIYSTFYFPNASITISKHFFYIMRSIPKSASQTLMEYEVYRNKNSSDEDFGNIDSIFKQVLKEDKDLCNAAQQNLNAVIYTNGQLHSHNEKGSLYFQDRLREQVMSHRALEREKGRDIWPTTLAAVVTKKLEEEIDFCNALDCEAASNSNDPLSW